MRKRGKYMSEKLVVQDEQSLNELIERVREAQKKYATYSQEQVDKIFRAAAMAADKARIPLAKEAVEETGMGIIEDKVIKNHFASEYIFNKYREAKTCDVIEHNEDMGYQRFGLRRHTDVRGGQIQIKARPENKK